MLTEFKTEKLMVKKERLTRNFEQLIENDLSLPDYCGDIIKILNCSSKTNIFSALIPAVSAVGAAMLGQEQITLLSAAGILVVTAGVIIAQKG